jgi:VanZ family protein
MLTKNLSRRNILVVAVLITLLIAYLSLMKVPRVQLELTHLDKLEHTLAYFVLGLSWFFSLKRKTILNKLIVFLICVFYGILLEVLQENITTYRTGDYLDGIANSLGVCFALLIFNLISKKNKDI